MSWLFGLRKDPNIGSPPPPENVENGGNPGQPSSSQQHAAGRGSHVSEAYRFDSSALERAAQAAKDLEKSSIFANIMYCILIPYLIAIFLY